jgi:hypothetical protein
MGKTATSFPKVTDQKKRVFERPASSSQQLDLSLKNWPIISK